MAITTAYFKGAIAIPNIIGADPASLANIDDLAWFIDVYEAEYLQKLLGETLYPLYAAGIAVPLPAAKWTALKNEIYWSTGTGGTLLNYSPAANYIYYHYARSKATFSAPNGEAIAAVENGISASAELKLTRAWNQMSRWTDEIIEWLEDNSATYPEFDSAETNELRPINIFGI